MLSWLFDRLTGLTGKERPRSGNAGPTIVLRRSCSSGPGVHVLGGFGQAVLFSVRGISCCCLVGGSPLANNARGGETFWESMRVQERLDGLMERCHRGCRTQHVMCELRRANQMHVTGPHRRVNEELLIYALCGSCASFTNTGYAN